MRGASQLVVCGLISDLAFGGPLLPCPCPIREDRKQQLLDGLCLWIHFATTGDVPLALRSGAGPKSRCLLLCVHAFSFSSFFYETWQEEEEGARQPALARSSFLSASRQCKRSRIYECLFAPFLPFRRRFPPSPCLAARLLRSPFFAYLRPLTATVLICVLIEVSVASRPSRDEQPLETTTTTTQHQTC